MSNRYFFRCLLYLGCASLPASVRRVVNISTVFVFILFEVVGLRRTIQVWVTVWKKLWGKFWVSFRFWFLAWMMFSVFDMSDHFLFSFKHGWNISYLIYISRILQSMMGTYWDTHTLTPTNTHAHARTAAVRISLSVCIFSWINWCHGYVDRIRFYYFSKKRKEKEKEKRIPAFQIHNKQTQAPSHCNTYSHAHARTRRSKTRQTTEAPRTCTRVQGRRGRRGLTVQGLSYNRCSPEG